MKIPKKEPNMADDLKFLIEDEVQLGTKIKVVGVGGGGSNAVARMLQEGFGGVEYYVLNTDKQALAASPVANKLALGKKLTNGLGAGADPSVGRQAALEETERIIEILEGADMVFVTAGLGGGTGTGAAPVVASLAKELSALTVAVVTKPFAFEGGRRLRQAERGLTELAASCDTVITVPNEKLLTLAPKGTSFSESCRLADDVLRQAVQGIADIITTPGLINRDFSDIRTIMSGMGYAMMGTATAAGPDAAVAAAQAAINSPLMDEGGILGARGVLINITASSSLGIHDVNEACKLIGESTQNNDVQINFGVVLDEKMGDTVKITVIATGFQRDAVPEVDRRNPHFPFTITTAPQPGSEHMPGGQVGSEPMPVAAEAVAPAPQFESAAEPAAAHHQEELPGMPDYEVPAYLRKQRRLVQ
jgi:cell division protein FtsZ